VNWEVVKFIVEYAKMKAQALQKNLTFALVSNLSLMDEDKLAWLLDNGVDICTSLDGDKKTHNWQRTYTDGDSHADVVHWINRINEENEKRGRSGYKIGALATWTKPGLKNYKNIIDSYIELGLNTIGLRWLNPYGFAAAERDTLEYSLDEYFEFYKNSMDYILEKNKQGVVLREMLSIVYLAKILNNQDSGFMDVRSPSGIAI
jgi:sulfatase maturation enzyme AslB (radical SAM superfamily)